MPSDARGPALRDGGAGRFGHRVARDPHLGGTRLGVAAAPRRPRGAAPRHHFQNPQIAHRQEGRGHDAERRRVGAVARRRVEDAQRRRRDADAAERRRTGAGAAQLRQVDARGRPRRVPVLPQAQPRHRHTARQDVGLRQVQAAKMRTLLGCRRVLHLRQADGQECMVTDVCEVCDKTFCQDCRFCDYCELCHKVKCVVCEISCFCEQCNKFFCCECGPCNHCELCRKTRCEECSVSFFLRRVRKGVLRRLPPDGL
mmetsp:Transcript_13439/g.47807  ORF Transcript_13439/g.47807 Transcript_13439/m.47807 type:complete len:256 (+) Transcript_13439:587-1354(+)